MELNVDTRHNEMATPVASSLLTVKDVVNVLPLSSNQVYLMASKGRIPSVRIGNKLYFKKELLPSFGSMELIRSLG